MSSYVLEAGGTLAAVARKVITAHLGKPMTLWPWQEKMLDMIGECSAKPEAVQTIWGRHAEMRVDTEQVMSVSNVRLVDPSESP